MNLPAETRNTGSLVPCELPPKRRTTATSLLDMAYSELLAPRLDGKREIFFGMTVKVEARKATDRLKKLSATVRR